MELYRQLKKCKSVREIYQVIPETFYEKCSFGLIIAMMAVIVVETITRWITRHASFNQMVNHFYVVGYVTIAFALIYIVSRIYVNTMDEIKDYFRNNVFEILLIIYVVWIFIAALLSCDKNIAFNGTWFRQNGFKTYLIYLSFYICGKNLKKDKYKRLILWSFCIVAAFQNTLMVSKYFGYFGGYIGAFYNSNHSGYFVMMAVFAAIALIIYEKKILLKVVAGVIYAFNLWCLIINNTFGCYIAAIMGLLFLLIVSIINYRQILIEILITIIIFISLSIYVDYKTGYISNNFGVTKSDIGKISSKTEDYGHAGTGRWKLWMESIQYINVSPIFGCGPENLEIVTDSKTEPHNEYLQISAEYGIPACVLYVFSMICLMIKKIRRLNKKDRFICGLGSIVFVYLCSAFFGVMLFYTAVYYYFFLGILANETTVYDN